MPDSITTVEGITIGELQPAANANLSDTIEASQEPGVTRKITVEQIIALATTEAVAPDLSGYAPLDSPLFVGNPRAPVPALSDDDASLATTSWVKAQGYSTSGPGGGAPLDSPIFTGDPRAPTPTLSDNDTSIATTNFVKAQGYAPLISPAFTGVPSAPTVGAGTNTTQIATTAHVFASLGPYALASSLATYAPLGSPNFTGTPQAPTPTTGDNSQRIATTAFFAAAAAAFAPLASPALTGTPTAPTASVGANTTQLATTAFVQANKLTGAAPLDSPFFTGNPRAPSPPLSDNSASIINSAWVVAKQFAPIVSPAFGGLPTVPRPDNGARNFQIPTTEWVLTNTGHIGAALINRSPSAIPIGNAYSPVAQTGLIGIATEWWLIAAWGVYNNPSGTSYCGLLINSPTTGLNYGPEHVITVSASSSMNFALDLVYLTGPTNFYCFARDYSASGAQILAGGSILALKVKGI